MLLNKLPQSRPARSAKCPQQPARGKFRPHLDGLECRWMPTIIPVIPGSSSSLQAAVAIARSGDTILVPDGDYHLTQALTFGRDNVHLVAQGSEHCGGLIDDGPTIF